MISRALGKVGIAVRCRAAVGLLLAACPATAAAATAPPIAQIEARIDEAVRARANDPRFKGLTEQQRREHIEFVAGNVLFAMAHEIGHMLVSELGLPVLGREEDAADSFAIINLLNMNYAFSRRVLTQSARGWFLSDRRSAKENDPTPLYDEHALDAQRAYTIVCLMVGSDPEGFRELAVSTRMPAERQRTCRTDYNNAAWSWKQALAPHWRQPDQPKIAIAVEYAKSEKYPAFAAGFRRILVLEEIAERLSDRFYLRRPIGLEMRECGEPGASWNPSTRKITLCYELCRDFERLYTSYAAQERAKDRPKSRTGRRKR